MPISVYIATSPTGTPLLDATPFVQSCQLATNSHGSQSIDLELNRNLYDAFRLYDAPGTLHVEVNDGAQILGAARLEDPGLHAGQSGAAKLNALGYQRALSDIPYTALWSDTSLERWKPISDAVASVAFPERYAIQIQDGQIEICPKKGETFAASNYEAIIVYNAPSGGTRQVAAIMFSYSISLPTDWQVRCVAVNAGYASASVLWTFTSTGAAVNGAQAVTTARDFVYFDCYYVGAGTPTIATDTGAAFATLLNIRVFGSTTNRNSTTVSAISGATPGVATITPGSMAAIYVGAKVLVSSAAGGEIVIVTAVTSTTFTASYGHVHAIGNTVVAHAVYADEMVRDLVSTISGVNSSQLSSATSGITSPGRDLVDAVYEDQAPDELITSLAATGNSSNQAYEWGVDDFRRVFFRVQGARSTTWYVDIDDLDLSRSLDGLYNSGYAVYEDTSGVPVRSGSSTNATSVLRYGVTRRQAIDVQTTNSTYATGVRDTTIAANATVQPRASFTVRAVYNSNGAQYPIAYVRANDIMVIRNLPPTASAAVDTIRTFRISRTVYDPLARTLQIEPEAPDPTLEALVGGQV